MASSSDKTGILDPINANASMYMSPISEVNNKGFNRSWPRAVFRPIARHMVSDILCLSSVGLFALVGTSSEITAFVRGPFLGKNRDFFEQFFDPGDIESASNNRTAIPFLKLRISSFGGAEYPCLYVRKHCFSKHDWSTYITLDPEGKRLQTQFREISHERDLKNVLSFLARCKAEIENFNNKSDETNGQARGIVDEFIKQC